MRCPVRRCSGRRIRRIRAAHAHGRSRRDARECVNGSTAKLVWLGTGPAAGLWLLQIMTMPSRTRSGTRNESSTSAPLPHADGASATAPRAGAPREARDGPRLDGHRPSSRQGLSQGGAQPNDGRRGGVARAASAYSHAFSHTQARDVGSYVLARAGPGARAPRKTRKQL